MAKLNMQIPGTFELKANAKAVKPSAIPTPITPIIDKSVSTSIGFYRSCDLAAAIRAGKCEPDEVLLQLAKELSPLSLLSLSENQYAELRGWCRGIQHALESK